MNPKTKSRRVATLGIDIGKNTFQQWARNFESRKDFIIERFGNFHYRRFRLYLWGTAYEFLSRSVDCYRMVIRNSAAGCADSGAVT